MYPSSLIYMQCILLDCDQPIGYISDIGEKNQSKSYWNFFDGELPYRFKLIRLMRFVSELFVFQFWIFYCSTEVNTTKGLEPPFSIVCKANSYPPPTVSELPQISSLR